MLPEIRGAIARFEVRDGTRVLSRGTGFLVTDRLVLTAFHVVGDRTQLALYEQQYGLFACFPGHECPCRVVEGSWDASADWALVECADPPKARPLPLAELYASGAAWETYGFPDANPQDGMVCSGTVENPAGEIQGVVAMQLFSKQAAAGNGSPVRGLSGAPVIVDGAAVGVLRYSLMKDGLNVAGTLYSCPVGPIVERASKRLPLPDPCWGLPGMPWRDLPPVPFRYLSWFTEDDAEIFFGRNREIRGLYERIASQDGAPVILLYGQSGVGKSSFLSAGVLPRLKPERDVLYVRRDADARLAHCVRSALSATGSLPIGDLWRQREAASGLPLVLLLDQVEEVFTRPGRSHADELEELFGELDGLFREAAARPAGRLVLCFRKEWYPEIRKPLEARKLPTADVFLERLGREGIIEAVNGLAVTRRLRNQYGLSVEAGLAARIADDLLEDRDSPVAPTLQILLTKLWEAATRGSPSKPHFSLDLYHDLKQNGLLLRHFLEQQLRALETQIQDATQSGLALDLLAYHTTPGSTAEERTREQLLRDYRHRADVVPNVVEKLCTLYLLSDSSQDRRDGVQSTRLAHDTLASLVRRMFALSDRPGQRARRILESHAAEWADGREGMPLDERDLGQVLQGLPAMRAPAPDEARLMQVSLNERMQRERRWRTRRVLLRGALVLVLASLGVAIWGWDGARRANQVAELRRTAAEALAQGNLEPAIGLTQAIKATGLSLLWRGEVIPAVQYSLSALTDEAREQNVYKHGTPIQAIAVSRDGALIASGGRDGKVRIWKIDGGSHEPVGTLAAEQKAVQSVAFGGGADGVVATGGQDGTVRLWDQSGRPRGAPLRAHAGSVNAVAFSPDGEWIASAGDDGMICLWRTDGALVGTLSDSNKSAIRSIAISPVGGRIAAASDDNMVRIWKLDGNRGGSVFAKGHEARVNSVAFTPDGLRIASGSDDRTVRIWNLDGTQHGRTMTGHDSAVNAVAVDPAGGGLVTGDEDGTVRRVDWDGNRLGRPFYGPDGPVRSVAYLPAGRVVVIGGADGSVRVRDYKGVQVGSALAATPLPMRAAVFAPDGQRLALGGDNGKLRIVDVKALPYYVEVPLSEGAGTRLTALAATPDRTRLVTGDAAGVVRFWDWSGVPSGASLSLGVEVTGLAASPDGKMIASSGVDGAVTLFDMEGRLLQPPLRAHRGSASSIAFHPAGQMIASGGDDGKVVVRDLNGKQTSEPVKDRSGGVTSIAFTRDGERLIVGGADQHFVILDWKTRRIEHEIKAHNGAVRSVAVNRDGSIIATAGDDATVALWSGATGELLAGLNLRHTKEVVSVAFHPLRNMVVSASLDGSVRLFRADWRDWLAVSCQRLRNHPSMVDPVWLDRDARSTCASQVWSKSESTLRDELGE
ncbi:MAG: trypsin-like peptidase domain-containing protein [Betaproteobacteria bacterium]|nr:trypsin-like peptidase domain-containing protein [Betaproteobacteria bacterium]